jgi:hypothetical protein
VGGVRDSGERGSGNSSSPGGAKLIPSHPFDGSRPRGSVCRRIHVLGSVPPPCRRQLVLEPRREGPRQIGVVSTSYNIVVLTANKSAGAPPWRSMNCRVQAEPHDLLHDVAQHARPPTRRRVGIPRVPERPRQQRRTLHVGASAQPPPAQ